MKTGEFVLVISEKSARGKLQVNKISYIMYIYDIFKEEIKNT